MPPLIHVKTPDPTPEVAVVTTQPRSIDGPDKWMKVTWHRDPVTGAYIARREPAERPPNGQVQVIPGADGLSTEALNYILGEASQKQEYARRKRERISQADIEAMAEKMWQEWNERWHEHVNKKIAFFKGATVSGPTGTTQRQKPGITEWSGVNPR